MAGWRDKLQPASFRGVPFSVLSESRKVGRRNVLHVFPQRDVGAVEDLGKVVNGPLGFQGYVIGPDFIARRDALIDALEKGGPGVLVHPVYGKIEVNAGECDVATTRDEGGMATFSLNFVVAGADPFPVATPDSGAIIAGAGAALASASAARFAARATVSTPFEAVAAVSAWAGQIAAVRAQVQSLTADMLRNPSQFVGALKSIERNLSALVYTPAALVSQVQALVSQIVDTRIVLQLVDAYAGKFSPGGSYADAYANEAARAFAQAVLVAAAYASADTAYVTYDDADAFRNRFADAAGAEQGVSDADAYGALLDLSNAVWDDIDARAADLVQVVRVDVPVPASSLELAQRLYADAERAAEIAERNGVLHPGWCYGSLSVLSA